MKTHLSYRFYTSALGFMALMLMGSLFLMTGCSETQDQQEAQVQQASQADPIVNGRTSYESYCLSCHGDDGKGNGEVTGDLATLPADLTQLTALNNGAFPVEKIYLTIDGRRELEAHGTREMPVWGNIWSESGGEPVNEEVVERRINELIEYLRTIQE